MSCLHLPPDGPDGWPADSFLDLLPEGEREVVFSRGIPVRFADDDFVVLQGESGDSLYVLTSGLVKVVVTAGNGAETAVAMRSRGDLIGEFALVDEKPRTATARAVGLVTAVRVSRAAWTALVRDRPAVRDGLARYLVGKIRSSTEQQAADRFWDARARLAQVLCDLADAHGEGQPDGTLRVPVTQGELGQFAGVGVSTAERELARLRGKGIVKTCYNAIIVCDLAQLRAFRFPGKQG